MWMSVEFNWICPLIKTVSRFHSNVFFVPLLFSVKYVIAIIVEYNELQSGNWVLPFPFSAFVFPTSSSYFFYCSRHCQRRRRSVYAIINATKLLFFLVVGSWKKKTQMSLSDLISVNYICLPFECQHFMVFNLNNWMAWPYSVVSYGWCLI